MNDQAKRWTANGRHVYRDSYDAAKALTKETATRLAACADLLRGVDDLSAVAVMTWADAEKVRVALEKCAKLEFNNCVVCGWNRERGHSPICEVGAALEALPVPPKGGAVFVHHHAANGICSCGDSLCQQCGACPANGGCDCFQPRAGSIV